MHVVCETSIFVRQAEKLFTPEELQDVINLLAANPASGVMIPGTGGVRKVRVPAKGQGKRSGARVIYYWFSDEAPVYALLAYGKGSTTDMTADEKKMVSALAAAIKSDMKGQTQ